jgi:Family of unknown function (DUF6502)
MYTTDMTRFSAEIVAGFVRAFLMPVVRFCLRRSYGYSEFSSLAKQIFYEIAEEEIRIKGQDVSVSRLSALTGLDRRDLTRFHKEGVFFARKENLLSRVIGQWEQDARFCKSPGRAKALTCEGVDSEFFTLVQVVSKDLNPYTVLGELERVQAIERKNDKVSLRAKVFVPREDLQDGLRILGLDARDLYNAVESNILQKSETKNLHIRTEYDNLDPAGIEKIRTWFLDKGAELHKEARNYLARFDKDLNPKIKQGGARAVIGSFSLVEDKNEDSK